MLYLLIIAKMVQMQKHFLWKHTPANQVLEGMEHMFRFCSRSGHPYESPLVCFVRSVLTEPSCMLAMIQNMVQWEGSC